MTSLVLLLAATLPAVPPDSGRPLPLRVERGQEFVYHASYTREGDRPGSRFTCYLDTYVLILDAAPQETRAAFMTVQRIEGRGAVEVSRLETGRIDALGRVTLDGGGGALPRLPIDGPPAVETYPFLELPRQLPDGGEGWTIAEEFGPQAWRALLTESRERGRCLKLKGEQSSGTWNQAGRLAWRRDEVVSLLLQEGYVDHAERRTEWRTEAGDSYRSVTVIDLDSPPAPITPGQFRDSIHEISVAVRFARDLAELTKPRGEPNYRGYDDLLRAMDRYLERDRGTPYAAAIRSLRRQADLARRGERPPAPVIIQAKSPPTDTRPLIDVGQSAGELSFRNSQTGDRLTLASLRGKPVVLLFFKPSSKLVAHVLRYAASATKSYAGKVHVVPLAIDGDAATLARLKSEYSLGAVYDGREALSAFVGRSTPRVVVLDGKGVVRVLAPGWGGEYSEYIHKELVKIVQEK